MNSVQATRAAAAAAEGTSQVYFVSLRLRDEVHAQALGFTRLIFEFVWAPDAAAAEKIAREYVAGLGNEVRRLAGAPSLSVRQDLNTYTFPEQILGLPPFMLDELAVLYPQDAAKLLRKRNALIAQGRAALAASEDAADAPAHAA